MLRRFLRKGASSGSGNELAEDAHRRTALLNTRGSVPRSSSRSGGGVAGLHWAFFEPPRSATRTHAAATQAATARSAYHGLFRALAQTLGELPPDALALAAAAAYNALVPAPAPAATRDDAGAAAELERALGVPVPPAAAREMAAQCRVLHQQRASALAPGAGTRTTDVSAPQTAAAPEFGVAIRFAYDADAEEAAESAAAAPAPAAAPARAAAGGGTRPSPSPAAAAKVDSAWLAAEVTKYLSVSPMALSVAELCAHIKAILQSARSEQALQVQLFEVLGEAGVELISGVVTHRAALLKALRDAPVAVGPQPARLVGQLTVQSSEELARQRRERKRGQRAASLLQQLDGPAGSSGLDARALRAAHEAQLRDANVLRPLLPAGALDAASTGPARLVLPEGHTWARNKDYDEVFIPPPTRDVKQQAALAAETRVAISELEEFGQLAFPNYTHLNRIQSILFGCAYRSNENLLVCAPTGAGKTDIAMLTIVHEVEQHLRGGVLHKDEFKIVYVAPMKALAAEMVANLGKRLQRLGVVTRELTGDMQLSKRELEETQLIVTTPEKWDVVTRKSSDVALTSKVRLLILDEVHLLHEDRGPVLESLVARTLRQVEATQQMIRIVGLSATLPNYRDVARFLRVNEKTGLFHFDATFRPVPLAQTYVGVREPAGSNPMKRLLLMNDITYKKVHERVLKGHQVMVFVHSRKDTVNTAKALALMALQAAADEHYRPDREAKGYGDALRQVERSRNRELKELFPQGFGIHHAGMLRPDRVLVEALFRAGFLRVLCCTATLAWGVNLPARAVIIKGTQVYNAAAGSFVPLGMLDVMQIFGRAGRPQFDSLGEGVIITAHDQLQHYLQLMTHQLPIESRFDKQLADHLNAEIVLGTVASVDDACTWLRYTYLYQRMARNPLVYGLTPLDVEVDPQLSAHCRALVLSAARTLDAARMIRFDQRSGTLNATDLGRTASHYYIEHSTIEEFNERLSDTMTEESVFGVIAHASEFAQIRVRDDEQAELDALHERCPVDIRNEDGPHSKVNVLLQAFLSNEPLEAFALVSDSAYIAQNAARIVRGLFEIALKRNWSSLALQLLTLCRCMDRRLWHFQHPLRQYPGVSAEIISKLEQAGASLERLRDMGPSEIGALLRHPRLGSVVAGMVRELPQLEAEASIQPVTRSILRVTVRLRAAFKWNDRLSGTAEPFWVWMADPEHAAIYHVEYFVLQKKERDQPHELQFVVPVAEPLPAQYLLYVASDRWLGADATLAVSFKHLILPHLHPPHTELLNLEPLPVQALHNPGYEALFKFSHFNPIQTQVFHTLMYRDCNVLLGAPTGSGKTIAAELAMFRLFNTAPQLKVVYVGPLKALVRERLLDWQDKFVKRLGKRLVELTGDYTPDVRLLQSADIVLTTPEKWDGISRNWRQRQYVKQVGLLVLDEIHLLGEERGPILEVIVSRMRYIAEHTGRPIRVVGLSTALANAADIAEWLGIDPGGVGMYNFRPAVRPVPLEVHIQAYAGKHYCLSEEHQILTDKGFMFLDELLHHHARDPKLLIAAYSHATKTISYEKPSRVVVNPAETQTMIELTSQPEAQRWGRASDAYGLSCDTVANAADDSDATGAGRPNSNGVSLIVTPEHDMFVRHGKFRGTDHHTRWTDADYHKSKACDLLRIAAVKTLGRAVEGFVPTGAVPTLPYVEQLAIRTPSQEAAFLEVFGYWLGDGTLAIGPAFAVRFNISKKHDIEFLRNRFAILNVNFTESTPTGKRELVTIDVRGDWYHFFAAEYGQGKQSSWARPATAAAPHLPTTVDGGLDSGAVVPPYNHVSSSAGSYLANENVKSAKWIPYWAWQLRKEQLRALISGLRRADGEEAANRNCIYTSSVRFRDELVRLCIHAGYAVHFSCRYRAGSNRGVSAWGSDIVANHDSWKVTYLDDSRWADPTLDGARGEIKQVQYTGRTWCVTVSSGLIVTRRACINAAGHVTKVSITQITGNCPRMATMNKPVYSAICTHSPDKPTLVFVSSRRQTRLTAIDLIATASSAGQPEQFLHMGHEELARVLGRVRDANLRHTLPFGIGLHHAGLADDDRKLVEELFAKEKIGVLISTSTLAWGVNLPAHLVVIKGTEFYDPKTKRYVDFPITDVLQMMGRAGRPQFDTSGIAVIMVHEPKKNFYRKFLYDPFPVESSLAKVLHDHLNAETVAGTIGSKQDAVDYLTWTYLFRRLSMNPSYYGLEQSDFDAVSRFLSATVDTALRDLCYAGCVRLLPPELAGADELIEPTTLGRIASFYYLHYSTVELFHRRIGPASDLAELLRVLTSAHEYADVPVRHNEELQNEQLAALLPLPVEKHLLDSPHTKAFLLLQAHFSHAPLPIQDFIGDSKTVLDQAVRILQAMVDVAADGGWLFTTLNCVQLLQMVYQATWHNSPQLGTLPHATPTVLSALRAAPLAIDSLPALMLAPDRRAVRAALTGAGRLPERSADELLAAAARLPSVEASFQLPQRVAPRSEVSLKVTLTRHSKPGPVQAPRFHKRVDAEQWWAVLGAADTGELLALRRVAFSQRSASASLVFDAPDAPGDYRYALYVLCDAYFGLDQQFTVPFTVVL